MICLTYCILITYVKLFITFQTLICFVYSNCVFNSCNSMPQANSSIEAQQYGACRSEQHQPSTIRQDAQPLTGADVVLARSRGSGSSLLTVFAEQSATQEMQCQFCSTAGSGPRVLRPDYILTIQYDKPVSNQV